MSMAGIATPRRDTQASSMKPHVLIVEDEAALVELLRYNLEQSGFRVGVAGDGEEALRSLKRDARGGTGGGPCRPAASGVLMDSEGVKHLPCQPGKK